MIGFHILDAKNLRFPRHFSPAQISQLAEFGQRSRDDAGGEQNWVLARER
jgi:hypothetical protein